MVIAWLEYGTAFILIFSTLTIGQNNMSEWRRKYLGEGLQVYHTLRAIRDHRFCLDRYVAQERLYTVAIEVESLKMYVFFPPGNTLLADLMQASDCEVPTFSTQKLADLYREPLPINPVVGRKLSTSPSL